MAAPQAPACSFQAIMRSCGGSRIASAKRPPIVSAASGCRRLATSAMPRLRLCHRNQRQRASGLPSRPPGVTAPVAPLLAGVLRARGSSCRRVRRDPARRRSTTPRGGPPRSSLRRCDGQTPSLPRGGGGGWTRSRIGQRWRLSRSTSRRVAGRCGSRTTRRQRSATNAHAGVAAARRAAAWWSIAKDPSRRSSRRR